MKEQWKPIPGYEGRYEVSNQGKVRNARKKILAPCNVSGGYLSVSLGKNNSRLIHRLVASAFLTEQTGAGPLVLHGDGNRHNNQVSNLRYGTHLDNAKDAAAHGTQVKGSKQHAAKLTEADIHAIRAAQSRTVDLARQYKVTSACISAIITRKNWRHV